MIIPDSNQQIKSFKISIPLIKTVVIVAFSIIMAATISLVYFGKTTAYLYTVIAEKDKEIEQLTSLIEEQDKK